MAAWTIGLAFQVRAAGPTHGHNRPWQNAIKGQEWMEPTGGGDPFERRAFYKLRLS
jgi:hypothetical protein